MTWVETLNECWNILKNELLKENINYIEHFMNYIFIDLFPVLNEANTIEDFENLIKIENELESAIQEMIKKYKNGGDKYGFNEKQKDENKTSIINLLLEKYTKDDYNPQEYPFYEFFYYTDYLNENYISQKLGQMYYNKYPVLKKYLDNKNNNEKNRFSLENLYQFNNTLNMIDRTQNGKIKVLS